MLNVKNFLYTLKSENTLGVLFCFLFSSLSLVLLIKVKPPFYLSNNPPIAQIKKFTEGAKQRLAGTISFVDIEALNKLQNNDEVYTGKSSKLTIEFLNSKNIVSIPSNSLVRIQNNSDGEILEIKEGRADITIKKGMIAKIISNGQTVQLTNTNTEDGIIRASKLKDTIQFNQLNTSNSNTEIKPMKIEQIATPIESENLNNNIGPTAVIEEKIVQTPPSPPVIIIEKSKIQIDSPKIDQQFGLKENIQLKWSNSKTINFSIAKSQDQLFSGNIKKLDTSPAEISNSLGVGNWYLGIQDENGDKTIIPIEIVNNYKIINMEPIDNDNVELLPGSSVVLNWQGQEAKEYEVILKDYKGNESKRIALKNHLKIENAHGNFIEWSVTPILKDGTKAPTSEKSKFNLNFKGELKFNESFTQSNIFQLSENSINISWNSPLLSKLTILDENDEKIVERQSTENSFKWTALKLGRFKASLQSIDYPTLKPAITYFEIHTPVIEWSTKNENEYFAYEPKLDIQLNFKVQTDDSKKFIPYIQFNSSKINQEDVSLKIENDKLFLSLRNFGHYCIKFLPAPKFKYYDNSPLHCFDFKELEPFKVIPELRPTILKRTKVNGLDAYSAQIPTIERAIKYHFEIYKNSDMKELLFEYDSITPNLIWVTHRSGIFYYRYKVFDYKNRESNYSNLSKFIMPISPLSKLRDE